MNEDMNCNASRRHSCHEALKCFMKYAGVKHRCSYPYLIVSRIYLCHIQITINYTVQLYNTSNVKTYCNFCSCIFLYRKWLLHRFVDNCLASSIGSNASSGSNACDSFVNMDAIDLNMDASFNGIGLDHGPDLIHQPDYHEQIRKELNVCKNAADNHPCNYNAWSHRIWVVQHCFNGSLQVRTDSSYMK